MRKITQNILVLIFSISIANSFAQTISTGTIPCNASLNIEIKISPTLVTATINGPSNRWFAIGLGSSAMNSANKDIIYSTGGAIIDGTLSGNYTAPVADATQSWTMVSNTVAGGTRTVVSTRVLNTGEANDYVFSNTDTSINLIWAHSSASTSFGYHGGNKGILPNQPLTVLGIDSYTISNLIAIYPNPVSNKESIMIKTNNVALSSIVIFDLKGRKIIYKKTENQANIGLDISPLAAGIYTVIISSKDGQKGIKKLLVNK